MKITTIDRLHEFNRAYQIHENPEPGMLGDERIRLRIKLIAEEFMELCDALGYYVTVSNEVEFQGKLRHDTRINSMMDIDGELRDKHIPNIAEIADALGDLDYVVAGTATEMGIPHDEIVAEIHRSNMSKLGVDGKPILREDGKVLKGPNYTPPNLWPILMKAGVNT